MRVMVMIEGDGVDEDKIAPTEQMLAAMGAYNEQLVNAGIMLDGDGLKPTSAGARIVFESGTTSVVDGWRFGTTRKWSFVSSPAGTLRTVWRSER